MIFSYSTVRRALNPLFFFIVSGSRGTMMLDGSIRECFFGDQIQWIFVLFVYCDT